MQFYQDTLESNDDEKEGDFEMKENDKNADKDAAGLKGKSEEGDEEDQNCKYWILLKIKSWKLEAGCCFQFLVVT